LYFYNILSTRNNLNLVTGELKNPKKNLPRALKIGCFSVISSYIVANVAYYAVLSAEVAKTSKTIVSVSLKIIIFNNYSTIINII